MKTPTEKQMAYRNSLIAQALNDYPALVGGAARQDTRAAFLKVANAAMALSFPVPATVADCSAQIDALKAGFAVWAKRNRAEGDALLAKLVAAFGQDASGVPMYDPMEWVTDGKVDGDAIRADFRAKVAAAIA